MNFINRKDFDSIVRHYINPVIGQIRLDPEDKNYSDKLNRAYDKIFEDLKNSVENENFNDHPDSIIIDDVSYSVLVNRNGENEIQSFGLYAEDGEIFFEYDWSGEITADNIVELINEDKERNSVNSSLINDSDSDELNNEKLVEPFDDNEKIKEFDFHYPYYNNYDDEFKIQAIDDIKKFSDESQDFKIIMISEWFEDWEEFGEF